jgi:hypothetical protein
MTMHPRDGADAVGCDLQLVTHLRVISGPALHRQHGRDKTQAIHHPMIDFTRKNARLTYRAAS